MKLGNRSSSLDNEAQCETFHHIDQKRIHIATCAISININRYHKTDSNISKDPTQSNTIRMECREFLDQFRARLLGGARLKGGKNADHIDY